MRKAARILLKLINSVPPMQREAVLAKELDRIIRMSVDGVLRNLTALINKHR